MNALRRKLSRAFRNLPNLLQGYNLYVNQEKLRLIDRVLTDIVPEARSFADLGGVWRVNAAYTRHTLRRPAVARGVLVDTDCPEPLARRLLRDPRLELLRGDFGSASTARRVGAVDVAYFFDVLLHQACPHWDEVLALYPARCVVIYNQQYVLGPEPVRLTSLPLERYVELTSRHQEDYYREVYRRREEIHPKFGKRWIDIHTIAQWGITDSALRRAMDRLGYKEVFSRNYGTFLDLPAFENHAFVFLRQ